MTHLPDNRYILYRREWDAARGKWGKYPCDRYGRNIDAHDTSHWMTRAEALSHTTEALGLAWVLNGDGWFFLDLDNCGPQWTAEATSIYQSFGGALGEVSMSGTGLHIFGQCDPAKLVDRRNKWGGWCEFYTTGRFVALSRGEPQPIGPIYTGKDWTDQLLRLVPQREFLGELPDGVDPSYTGPESDDVLLSMAMRSHNMSAAFGLQGAVSFSDLWSGNAAVLGVRWPGEPFDRSSADMALMSQLAFWTGKDMPRMDRLFRRSALVRDKYTQREDYRRMTIEGAARLTSRVYDRPRAPAPSAPVAPTGTVVAATTHEAYLTIPEMIKHFEGCVYVRTMHRVLVPDGGLLKPEQFAATYGGHMFQMMPDGTKPTRNAFEAFTQNCAHRFPQAIETCFRPNDPPGTIGVDGRVNIYVPPKVDCRAGDVSPFLDLLRRLLPDDHDRAIILNYMAAVVQYPGVKFQWAPVLQGCEGNGKTAVFSALIHAVGARYTHQPRAKQLGGQFNSWVEGKLFILVEEVHMEGRRDVLDALKPLITNVLIEAEQKSVDQRMIDNLGNWAFCTNYQEAVLKSRNDRRYAVFFTAQQRAEDIVRDGMGGDYFPRLYQWLRAEGYAFVTHFLRTFTIDPALNPAGSCHRAPVTSSTEAAIEASIGGIELHIVEAIDSEQVGFRGNWVSMYHLEELAARKRMNISPKTLAKVLRDMGYEEWGRASRPIMAEAGNRKKLWCKGDVGGFENYLRAQGPSYT